MAVEANKGFPLKAAAVLIYVLFLLVVPPWMVQAAFRQELSWFTNGMGVENARWIARTGEGWYDSSIMDSGLQEGIKHTFVPTEQERVRSGALKDFGYELWFPYLNTRGEVLLQVLHQLFYRLAMLVAWVPFLLLAVIPATIDGMLRWRVRQFTFDFSSPFMHAMGFRGALHGTGIVASLLFLPLPVFHPYTVPIVIICYAIMMYWSASNTQKRV